MQPACCRASISLFRFAKLSNLVLLLLSAPPIRLPVFPLLPIFGPRRFVPVSCRCANLHSVHRCEPLTVVPSHGRDNALRIWQLSATDETHLSSLLPTEGPITHHPKPWLLHMLPVNTLNFCAFSLLPDPAVSSGASALDSASHYGLHESLLVAVPARDDNKIEVYRFPDEKLTSVVPRVHQTDTGKIGAFQHFAFLLSVPRCALLSARINTELASALVFLDADSGSSSIPN